MATPDELRSQAAHKRLMAATAHRIGPTWDRLLYLRHALKLEAEAAKLEAEATALEARPSN
jgi:hypothetical protein